MNWDAISAIGEAVSAICVIISLLYLARQIHESNQSARQAAGQELMTLSINFVGRFSEDAELSALWLQGNVRKTELSRQDQFRYDNLVLQLFSFWERMYFFYQEGKLDDWIWEESSRVRRRDLTIPGFVNWFERNKDVLHPQWVEFLQQEYRELMAH